MIKKSIAFIIFLTFIIAAKPVGASTIFLFASDATVSIGDKISVDLKIDSEETSINAAQATLHFSKDILSIENVSKTGSIFNFWLEEPSFSNNNGTLSFIGGGTSGYSGKSLHILKINFKVIGNGAASLYLSDGAVTASDGNGTNVLQKMGNASIISASLGAPKEAATTTATSAPLAVATSTAEVISLPTVTVLPLPQQIVRKAVKAAALPDAPKIDVPLYPEDDQWYNVIANFLAKWDLPTGISDVATAFNSNPTSNPQKSEGLFDNKFFSAPKDGVSYLHVRFKNNRGWGKTAHYKISIDTAPPASFTISPEKGWTTDYPTQKISFSASDGASGIDNYIVQIGNNSPTTTEDTSFILPLLSPGAYTIKVRAKDGASNITESTANLTITPIASPKITFVSADIYANEGNLNISGTSAANFSILLNLKNGSGQTLYSSTASAGTDGAWSARFDQPLKKGQYYIEATSKDSRGALSLPVKSNAIKAQSRPILILFGLKITETIFFLSIIVILAVVFFAGWFANRLWRKKVGSRVMLAERDVSNACDIIQSDAEMLSSLVKKTKVGVKKGATDGAKLKYLAERIRDNIAKMRAYILENIKEIKD